MTLRDKKTGKIFHNVQMIRSGNGKGDWLIFVADERPFPPNWNEEPFPVERFEEIEEGMKK